MENSFSELIEFVEQKTSFKCHGYKERPLMRRVRVRMRALGLRDFSQYYDFLKDNPDEIPRLLEVLTINLSYFFRNPETFQYLKNEIFPQFMKRDKTTFWSAGCAQGEEPYSLAILTAEAGLLNRISIYGTDIDEDALRKAKEGCYSASALQYTSDDIVAKYFRKENSNFRIIERIKSAVQFIDLNLFTPPYFGPCNLIMCRNVLIYLNRQAQSVLLNNFYNQLESGGYLVLGKVELLLGVPEARLFEVVSAAEHVYKKIGS